MAEVKWIKLTTDIFDNRKIKQIECLPEGDAIIVIWLKLLCLSGNINDSGLIYFTKELPYTDQMLATQFGRPLTTVQLALKTFEQFGMVEVIDNILHISNWEKYQSADKLSEIREYNRLAKQKSRAKQKLLQQSVNDMSMTSQPCQGTDIDKDIDKDKEEDNKEIHKEKNNYQQIIDLYNSICVSLPSVRSLSEARKKAIKARLNIYTVDDFEEVFKNAENSSFLKGGNNSNWTATFDWLIKDGNFAKVLDGNYTDNSTKPQPNNDTYNDLTALTYRRTGIRRIEPQMAVKTEPPKTVADDESIRERAEALKAKLGNY